MRLSLLFVLVLAACGSNSAGDMPDATTGDVDAATVDSVDTTGPCTTRIEYGSAWMKSASHTETFDIASEEVTWDGTCTDDGTNSFATLSNGWKPYFRGHQACAIALDTHGACATPPAACATRITYANSWLHPGNHPAQHDDVPGRVFWDGSCTDVAGGQSRADVSNGWQPHFSGSGTCGISQRWTSCSGLYTNSTLPKSCADPGVTRDGNTYVLTCTSGNAANAFPLYTSTDLVTWTPHGHILPSAAKPTWAQGDYWAPEIHKIGATYIAYFTALGTNGHRAIGTATATTILGPYTAQATPIVQSSTIGLIDATHFTDGTKHYLVWKEDGNARGVPTPIRGALLSSNGLSITGATPQLITNDQAWEGNLVEGPAIVRHDGMYYMFYSGNAFYDGRYAVGIARSTTPLGPYTKLAGNPILKTGGVWVGPGHCSVVEGPGGGTYMVYHAWAQGHVNGPGDGRMLLVDQIQWRSDGWPDVFGGPSSDSRPLP